MMKRLIYCFLVAIVLIWACAPDDSELQIPSYDLSQPTPDFSQATDGAFHSDQDELIQLGRTLFYDVSLSATDEVSCASCHIQEFAFADPHKHSIGINGQLSSRNSPTLINSFMGRGLFWDQSAADIQDLILKPIANHEEMGIADFEVLSEKLAGISYYPALFERAYGQGGTIDEQGIKEALLAFVEGVRSNDSDFDNQELTDFQKLGQSLFISKRCNSCHNVLALFSINDDGGVDISNTIASSYTGAPSLETNANIGLDLIYNDKGIAEVTGNESDEGVFKIPSLRNVALTPPYMHDGRFATLREVMDFYSEGVKNHKNLDNRMKDGDQLGMPMTTTEKEAIIAFLSSLTSRDILENQVYSSPF